MTTSSVDVTFPVDNVRVSKATWRAQQVIIKAELNNLFTKTGVAGALAYGPAADWAT